MKPYPHKRFSFAFMFLLVAVFCLFSPHPALAAPSDVVISQVFGGGGNSQAPYKNDFVELFNRSTTAVVLEGWSLQYASATGTGNFSANPIVALSGSLQPGQYYLIQLSGGANGAALPTPDKTGTINMAAGAGKIALVNTTTGLTCNGGSSPCQPNQLSQLIDLVGWGNANFYENGPAPATSNILALFRNNSGCQDSDNNTVDFTAAAPGPRNSASPLSACNSPTNPTGIGSVDPAAAFPGQPILLTAAVTPGNYPVSTGLTVIADLSPIAGSASQIFFDDGTNGDLIAGDLIFSFIAIINSAALPGIKTISILVSDEQNRTGSASIPFVVSPELSGIHDVQGAGHLSPLTNSLVCIQGVTTAKRANGFYLQDIDPDNNDATSEGIFVFTGSAPNVVVGDLLLITGTVKEYRASGVTSVYLTNTELENPGYTLTLISRNHPLPAPIVIGSGGRIPPATIIEDDAVGDIETSGIFDPADDGLDFYESLEAMLVQVNDAITVGPTKDFGSNRELPVVGDNGTHAGLFNSRGGLVIRPDDFNPERLILNDLILDGPTLPTADQGDKFPGPLIGVLDYSFGNYKLELISLPALIPGGLAQEILNDPAKYDLTAATFNVENLAPNDRPAKFATLADLIVQHLKSPDLLGIEEIQDNSGAKDDGTVDAAATWNKLIAAVLAAGGPAYAYRQIDPVNDQDGGAAGGNIRVGFLFRSDRGLSFTDRPGASALTPNTILNGATGPELQYSPGRIDPADEAFTNSRKPLAGEFLYRGHKLFIILNHFNSKGGDTPLAGRFQPPILNSEVQRIQQATVIRNFVQSLLNIDPNANVIVLGDLNDFQFSKPLQILKSTPLYDLIETLPEAERYSYVYEGNAQALDHILFSEGFCSRPLAYGVVHVNSEFAVQASDHDPQAVYVTLNNPPFVFPGGPYTVSEGDTVMVSAAATDPEGGLLTYVWDLDQDNVFETSGQTVVYTAVDGPSSRTLKIQVTDDGGLSTSAPALVMIRNIAPTVGPIKAPAAPVLIRRPVKVEAPFTDPGVQDTHKAVWNWDDGHTSVGVIKELNGSGSVTGKHTYRSPGIYKVTLSVTDKDGDSNQAFYEPVVVYRPDSFTTGSGWIQSPQGAFPADPTATGYAGFHFTVKNKKHATAPEGRTEFILESGGLHFRANDFAWLVADRNSARLKGFGTVNGQGSYSFMLEATESSRHKPAAFRIKIWQDLNGAEKIIYDNKNQQALISGHILVH